MKISSKKILLGFFVFLFLTFSPVLNVYANDDETASPTPKFRQVLNDLRKTIRRDTKDDLKNLRASISPAKEKIKEERCKMHVKVITSRAKSLADRGDTMIQRFDAISSSVQSYYLATLVPQGKTLSNYNALIADIAAKKAAITPLAEKVKTDVNTYTCDNENPRGEFKSFKTDMQNLIKAVKDYRKSVRNLIVAVIGISPKPSVAPSLTPSATPTEAL